MKTKILESEIKKSIMKWLRLQPDTFSFVVTTTGVPDGKARGGFRKNPNAGISDIIVCKAGRFGALEVKRPGGVTTPAQETFLNNVDIQGRGYCAVVYSLEDAQTAWSHI